MLKNDILSRYWGRKSIDFTRELVGEDTLTVTAASCNI